MRYLGLLTRIGLTVVLSAISGAAVGASLDQRFGTALLTPVFLIAGVAGGFYCSYRFILDASRRDNRRNGGA